MECTINNIIWKSRITCYLIRRSRYNLARLLRNKNHRGKKCVFHVFTFCPNQPPNINAHFTFSVCVSLFHNNQKYNQPPHQFAYFFLRNRINVRIDVQNYLCIVAGTLSSDSPDLLKLGVIDGPDKEEVLE